MERKIKHPSLRIRRRRLWMKYNNLEEGGTKEKIYKQENMENEREKFREWQKKSEGKYERKRIYRLWKNHLFLLVFQLNFSWFYCNAKKILL